MALLHSAPPFFHSFFHISQKKRFIIIVGFCHFYMEKLLCIIIRWGQLATNSEYNAEDVRDLSTNFHLNRKWECRILIASKCWNLPFYIQIYSWPPGFVVGEDGFCLFSYEMIMFATERSFYCLFYLFSCIRMRFAWHRNEFLNVLFSSKKKHQNAFIRTAL